MNFQEYGTDYLDRQEYRLAASTTANYRSCLSRLQPILGDKDLTSIRKRDLEDVAKTLYKEMSLARVRLIVKFAISVLNDAFENDVIEKQVKKIKFACDQEAQPLKPLSPEIVKSIIAAADKHYQPIFKFLFYTGMRPCEVCALRWSDIKEDGTTLTINKGRVNGIEGPTKTKRTREIAITPAAKELLASLSKSPAGSSDHVFISKLGKPINGDLDRIWRQALRRSKQEHCRAYELRHAFVSNAAAHNVQLGYISKHIGHSNIQTTFRFYYGVMKDCGDQKRLNEAFSA